MGRQREMAVLVTLGLLVLSFETTLGQKYKPLTGTAGQAVIIQCGSSRDGCSWSKDGTRLSLDERSDQARFRSASCDLTIEPLLPGDEGKYDCNNGPSRHHRECWWRLGCPTSRRGGRAWCLTFRRVVRQSSTVSARAGDGWRTRSTFTFRPLVATNVTCSASNKAVIEPRVSSALEVRVRGRPRVEVKVDQEVVREGDSFEVLCKSSAYPQDVGYRWFFSGAE